MEGLAESLGYQTWGLAKWLLGMNLKMLGAQNLGCSSLQ